MNRARGFKFVMVGIIILNLINIYILFLPTIDYYIYRICADDYIIEKATVVDMQEKAILRGKVSPLIGITETKVTINQDEEVNYEKLYTYPECEMTDEIVVAVSDGIVRRCIPYEFIDKDLIDMFVYIISTFVCLILYVVISKTEKRQEVSYVIDDFDIYDDMNIQRKKEYVIDLMKLLHMSSNRIMVDKKEVERQLGCSVDENFVWCIEHFAGSSIENLVFPFANRNEEFCYIEMTRKCKEQGLPQDYYVIGYKNNILMCCCAHKSRMYAFSRGIGLTNTKYFDIYDYLIECLEEERKKFSNNRDGG